MFALSFLLFGALLGVRHALEPDHLAAVSTLVTDQRSARSASTLGAVWGLGHTAAPPPRSSWAWPSCWCSWACAR
jgi:high-affinity nickel permease